MIRQTTRQRRWLFRTGIAGILLVMLLSLGLVLAAGETLTRSVVSSGGDQVSTADLTVQSSVGQPVVGAVTNGVTVCSGLLCGADVPIQTPEESPDQTIFLPAVAK